ncbi:MliC family protein [Geminicoccus harenae]|uniref:MliC family protein n=1 Tax=Geminicoccus harenae TaxID=2498453 RepID=UPI00168BAB62|nr:MliC family protein [Geminicoccus harenae]
MPSGKRKIDIWPAALAAAALAAMTACAAQPKNDPEIRDVATVTYHCENGNTLEVWFEPDSAIVSENGGETLIIPQQRSASGMWYADAGNELRGKGDEASWTADGKPTTQCKVPS